jgi:hypothetical protein
MGIFSRKKSVFKTFILITGLSFFFSGCSGIRLETKFIPKTSDLKWEKKRIGLHSYTLNSCQSRFGFQYNDNDISLTVLSFYNKDSCSISIGPPFFPIIPFFFNCFSLKEKVNLNFEIAIENFGDPISIDTKEIKLTKSGERVATHPYVYICALAKENYFSCPNRRTKNPTLPVTLQKGSKILLSLTYNEIDSNENYEIEFGKISTARKNLKLPPLILRNGYKIIYCPIILIGHEPCFIND